MFLVLFALLAVAQAAPLFGVSGDDLVINLHYPDALLTSNGVSSLSIRGNECGLAWEKGTAAIHSQENRWSVTVSCSEASITKLEFKAIAGSVWQIGANFIVDLTKKQKSVDVYPWFFTTKGTIEYIRNVKSEKLNNTRDLVLYLPPSYHENTLKDVKNLLVMHDGQNLFDPKTAFMGNAWMCQDTINQLIATGEMEEIAIIGIDNTPERINELTYSYDPAEKAGGNADAYLEFIEKTAIPAAMSKYRFSNARKGIAGSSLGGLVSCYAAFTKHTYTRAACMSSSFWWNNEDFLSNIIPNNPKPSGTILYIDSGDSGTSSDDKDQTLRVVDALQRLGWKLGSDLFYYLDKGGEHSETYWRKRFHFPMTDLYPIVPL